MADSKFKVTIRKIYRHRSGKIGTILVVFTILIAVVAPFFSLVDPYVQNLDLKFIPPVWNESGKWPYILGTDILGRDLLSRLISGAHLSLLIGFISVGVGAIIGIPLGLFAGYYGNKIDNVIMRIIDVLLAFPSILLAVCIVAILGPSLNNAMIAIGIVAIPTYARVARASALSLKAKEFILADIALGRSNMKIIFFAILPNIMGPIFIVATLGFAGAVLEASGLSFIGLGAQPPQPEWGALLLEGKKYIYNAPWLILYPGIAILFVVMGFNLLGDALRDVLDPKIKD